ncbi:MAG TPA: TetR/AcrR family transcriptional regulator [Beijerinckiaceae bacterium]|nr:TetR/AcrR family transcriptional regulator [Beijerinckiaceae bacterium]
MAHRPSLSAEETRGRILEVAEEHFRRVGYAKTAIADIAAVLGMSPANVYRFFASKADIKAAIADKLMSAGRAILRHEAEGAGTAAERLLRVAMLLHRYNKQQFTADRRLHDMVEAAMSENWTVIQDHLEQITGIFADIIRSGIASGEFALRDPLEAGRTLQQMMASVCHPTLIAQCVDVDLEEQTERIVGYFVRSLKVTG